MSKFTSFIVGGLEIAAGIIVTTWGAGWGAALGVPLIIAGAGSVIAGVGTQLSQEQFKGFVATVRNSTAPWDCIYGQVSRGGVIVRGSEWTEKCR